MNGDVQWAVVYGGPDPADCAGTLIYSDSAEASEIADWIPGSLVFSRTVSYGPWTPEPDDYTEGDQP